MKKGAEEGSEKTDKKRCGVVGDQVHDCDLEFEYGYSNQLQTFFLLTYHVCTYKFWLYDNAENEDNL